MARQLKILGSALAATSAMTLFSYVYSLVTKDNSREPELLGKLMHRLFPGNSKSAAKFSGWVTHYGVGLLFAELYGQIWQRSGMNPNPGTGLVFGGLSGIAAILIWKFTLTVHPFAPVLDFDSFALNLFLAHFVFGLFAALGYR